MRSLNVILMLLGAVSVLLLGAAPGIAMTTEAPPCHQAAGQTGSGQESPASSGKVVAAMACCVSCVVTPALLPPARTLAGVRARPAPPVPASLPIGLSPAPEPGPPKT